MAQLDAMRHGRKVLRDDAEVSAERVAEMGAAEKEAFLFGTMKALQDKMGSVRDANAASSLGMTPNSRAAIRTAMTAITPDARKQDRLIDFLLTNMQREQGMAANNRAYSGATSANGINTPAPGSSGGMAGSVLE